MLIISVGDVGTTLLDTVTDSSGVVNLSTSTVRKFIFTKPDGTEVEKNASFYTDGIDGKLKYTTIIDDIDIAGMWQYVVKVTFTSGEWTTPTPIYFQVEELVPWQLEMLAILRVLIWDMDSSDPEYTDSRLKRILVVAAQYIANELDFAETFTCNVVQITIAPDPTVSGHRDENFINLTCLKAGCIIQRGTANLAAGQAARVKDGPTDVDLREIWKARLALIDKGLCKVYEQAENDYVTYGRVLGAAVLTPFRLYGNYNYPVYRPGRI